jgi:phospholipase/carboxylesterase
MEILPFVEIATGPDPRGTVIWMHGLGADGWDFVPIVRELGLPPDLPLRFVFPHADERAVTINNGAVMRAWYDIVMMDLGRKADERGIRASHGQVEALIAREKARGVPAASIVLAGFSQGGVMALHAGLRHAEPLAGIMALSTYLALEDSLSTEASAANRATPILMAHGSADSVIPLSLADASRKALVARGYRVEWHAYPMPHSVCPEEVEAIAQWLTARFASP